ncbi:hypothetical protein [Chryseobacterium sp.]|uniref:hypothetical protein n=1 Tax=Chryseobacterium sp. TaxID=1871047 RepID=UPI0024E1E150|nr:hypothetical protein [Chryseobacterium sp.]
MAKLVKTILGKKIQSYEFSKRQVARLYKQVITGFIWLEDGVKIQVDGGKYYILNEEGHRSGIVLITNPGHQRIKRLIARWFSTYRRGVKGGQMHHVEYWKSRVLDGLRNISLFKYSEIKFSENKSKFLKLAS